MREEFRRLMTAMIDNRVRSLVPNPSCWCKVKSVSSDGQFCDVTIEDGDDTDDDVVVSDILIGYEKSGVLIKPAINRLALVVFVTKNSGLVVAAEKTDDMELMGSNYGEIPVVNALKTKINALETEINNLKTIITGWVPAPNDGGAALKAAASAWASAQMTMTTANDIKGKVKHGNGQ